MVDTVGIGISNFEGISRQPYSLDNSSKNGARPTFRGRLLLLRIAGAPRCLISNVYILLASIQPNQVLES